MSEGTTAKIQFSITICLLIILPCLSASENLKPVPVLGRDPILAPLIVEDHSQALAHWAEQGIRDAVLVNFDAHSDIRRIPDSKIAPLQDIYSRRDWNGFKKADSVTDQGLYNVVNWIYAGARLGIIREVYWVIPKNLFSADTNEQQMRRFLLSNLLSLKDIETFRFRNNRFYGIVEGIPVTICSPESLPDINEPLLLSIDTDFFPEYSHKYRTHYLASLNKVFKSLFTRQYRIQGAALSYSVNGEYLFPHLRWVGDTAAMILENPEILGEPPSDKLKLLMQLDYAYRVQDFSAILRHSTHFFSSHPEASVFLYKAYAHMVEGDTDKAYEAAIESCNMDRKYCAGLPYIGTVYFNRGKYPEAERFFRAGLSESPGLSNGLYCFAHCLREAGKLKEALAYYMKAAQEIGSFPADFLVFETCLLSGDRHKAADALKAAVNGLVQTPYAEVVDERAANAIHTAMDYAANEGLNDLLRTLRSHRAVKHMFVRYPRKSQESNLIID